IIIDRRAMAGQRKTHGGWLRHFLPANRAGGLVIFEPWLRSRKTQFEKRPSSGRARSSYAEERSTLCPIGVARALGAWQGRRERTPTKQRRRTRPDHANVRNGSCRGRVPLRLAAADRRGGALHHRQRRHVVGARRAAPGSGGVRRRPR